MSEDFQKAVVGALIYNDERQASTLAVLIADGLCEDALTGDCRTLLRAVLDNHKRNRPIDLLSIGQATAGQVPVGFIEDCVNACSTTAHAAYYWTQVRAAWLRKRAVAKLADALNSLNDGNEDPVEETLAKIQSDLSGLIVSRDSKSMHDVAIEELNRWANQSMDTCLLWPWDNLNEAIGPVTDEYIIIAAQPSVGKTAFALNLAVYHADKGRAVSVLSLESKKNKIAQRLLAQIGRVNTLLLRTGKGTPQDFTKALHAAEQLKALNLRVCDEGMTIEQIKAWAHLEKHRGSAMLIIDNMKHIRTKQSFKNRFDQFAEVSLQLKFIRDDTGLPVVALHHLNAEDKLAWSSDIERDADIILLMGENEAKTVRPTRENNYFSRWVVDITGKKNREGKTGSVQLDFVKKYQLFEEAKEPTS